jgi:hypothetical protein
VQFVIIQYFVSFALFAVKIGLRLAAPRFLRQKQAVWAEKRGCAENK